MEKKQKHLCFVVITLQFPLLQNSHLFQATKAMSLNVELETEVQQHFIPLHSIM